MSDEPDLLGLAATAVQLPEGAIPVHAYVIVEYENPGSDDSPDTPRVIRDFDASLSPWARIGLLRWMLQEELNLIAAAPDVDVE